MQHPSPHFWQPSKEPVNFQEAFMKSSIVQPPVPVWDPLTHTELGAEEIQAGPSNKRRKLQTPSDWTTVYVEEAEETTEVEIKTESKSWFQKPPATEETQNIEAEICNYVLYKHVLEPDDEKGTTEKLPEKEEKEEAVRSKQFDCDCCFKLTINRPHNFYQCPDCPFRAENYVHVLKAHQLDTHNTPIEYLPCNYCVFRARSSSELQQHAQIHTDVVDIEYMKCDLCPYEAKYFHQIKRHFTEAHHGGAFLFLLCGMCPHQTPSFNALKVHLLVCHPEQEKPKSYRVARRRMTVSVPMNFCIGEIVIVGGVRLRCRFCQFMSGDKDLMLEHVDINHSLLNMG